MKKIIAVLILVVVFVFSFAACSTTLDEQEIKEVLLNARNSVDLENLDQISLSAKGNISTTETENNVSQTTNMGIDFLAQITSKDNVVSSQNLQIKLSTDVILSGSQISGDADKENNSLIIESYYKEGNMYGYTNIYGDIYQYEEGATAPTIEDNMESLPMEDVNLSEIDEFINMFINDNVSKPSAVKKGKTITIKWELTIDDMKAIMLVQQKNFEQSMKEQFPDYELSTDEELMAEIDESMKGSSVNKFDITIKLVDENIESVSLDMDITETIGEGEQAATTNIKADLTIAIKTQNVVVNFDNERLAQIKAEYEKTQANQ